MAVQDHILARKKALFDMPYSASGKACLSCNLAVGQLGVLQNRDYILNFGTASQAQDVNLTQELFGKAYLTVYSPALMLSAQPCKKCGVIIKPMTQNMRGTIAIDQVVTRPNGANMAWQSHGIKYPSQKKAVTVDEADALNTPNSAGKLANASITIKKTSKKMIEILLGYLRNSHIAGFMRGNAKCYEVLSNTGAGNLEIISSSGFVVADLVPRVHKRSDFPEKIPVRRGKRKAKATPWLRYQAAIGIDEPQDPGHLRRPFLEKGRVNSECFGHIAISIPQERRVYKCQ